MTFLLIGRTSLLTLMVLARIIFWIADRDGRND